MKRLGKFRVMKGKRELAKHYLSTDLTTKNIPTETRKAFIEKQLHLPPIDQASTMEEMAPSKRTRKSSIRQMQAAAPSVKMTSEPSTTRGTSRVGAAASFPPPFNKDTTIDGVTVHERNINGKDCIFPVGGLDKGQCTSEAMSMMMRYALNTGNKALFQKLLNAYNLLAKDGKGVGLMPWSYNVNNGGVNIADRGSALDSDITAIGEMVEAAKKWPDLMAGNTSLKDYLKNTVIPSLSEKDIAGNGEFNPGSGWGTGPTVWNSGPFYDYVDFNNMQNILNFCKENGIDSTRLTTATTKYIQHEKAHVNDIATNRDTPDHQASLERTLMFISQFLLDPANQSSPPSQMYKDLAELLKGVMNKAVSSGNISLNSNGVTMFRDQNQFATIGIYLLTLKALKHIKETTVNNQPIDSLMQKGAKILHDYLAKGDDGNSIINTLKKDIQQKQAWDTGTYFNYMLFTCAWPDIASIPGIKP